LFHLGKGETAHPPTVSVLRLHPAMAGFRFLRHEPASPKSEGAGSIKYSATLLSFSKRPEQPATPKDIPLRLRLRGKTFAHLGGFALLC